MAQYNYHCINCQMQQQRLLKLHQKLERRYLRHLRTHCQYCCPAAVCGVEICATRAPANDPNQFCQTQVSQAAVVDCENVPEKIKKITLHKINVDKVTIGNPAGKGCCCDDVKLVRTPKICRGSNQPPAHQQPSSTDWPDNNVYAQAPVAENLQLATMSKGKLKEIPLTLGLLQLPKCDKKQDPNQKDQNIGVIRPVSSSVKTNLDDPPRTAVVVVKPKDEKKEDGSLDMLVVCQGKDIHKLGDVPETKETRKQEYGHPLQQVCSPEAPIKPRKKCRKKRKPVPPECFGVPPPILSTRNACSIC